MWNRRKHKRIFKTQEVFTGVGFPRTTLVKRTDNALWANTLDLIQRQGAPLCISGGFRLGKTTLVRGAVESVGMRPAIVNCGTDLNQSQLLRKIALALPPGLAERLLAKMSFMLLPLSGVLRLILLIFGIPTSDIKPEHKGQQIDVASTTKIARAFVQSKAVLILDDFHKLKPDLYGFVGNLLKEWIDFDEQQGRLQIVIIGSDLEDKGLSKLLLQATPDLRNRLSEISVGPMSKHDLEIILEKGEKLLNVSFDPAVKQKIVKHSLGYAGDCHNIASACCLKAGINQSQASVFTIDEAHLIEGLRFHYQHIDSTTRGKIEELFNSESNQDRINLLKTFCDLAFDGLRLQLNAIGEPDFDMLAAKYHVGRNEMQSLYQTHFVSGDGILSHDAQGCCSFRSDSDNFVYGIWRVTQGNLADDDTVYNEIMNVLSEG